MGDIVDRLRSLANSLEFAASKINAEIAIANVVEAADEIEKLRTAVIPGMRVALWTVSDTCRETHGDRGAVVKAIQRIATEAGHCVDGWPRGRGVKLHLALYVERPSAEKGKR
jgi:hypothetical protein